MTPSAEAKTAQDELVEALLGEVYVEDASPKDKTLAEHDKEKHPDGFDPETDTCKFRERIATETETDKADIENSADAPKGSKTDSDIPQESLSRRFDDGDDIRGDVSGKQEKGKKEAKVQPPKPMGISHIFTGTSANYDKPSLLKIGTGEGSQVYGWGLYGSNQRGVAETYADTTSDRQGYTGYSKGGKLIQTNEGTEDVESDAATLLALYGDRDVAKKKALNFPNGKAIAKELEEHGDEYKEEWPHAIIYEQTFFTDRAPDDESHLLRWYEPISAEQLERIENQFKKELVVEKHSYFSYDVVHAKDAPDDEKDQYALEYLRVSPETGERMSGQEAYEMITNLLGSPEAASEFLVRAGIDGVKYPVDSFGGKGVKDGNKVGWNYVSFRDDNIRIDKKFIDGQKMFDYQELMEKHHSGIDPMAVLSYLTRLDTAEEMAAEFARIMESGRIERDKTVQDELYEALVEDADTLKDQTLQEHDRQHHPGGYHEGDTCKFRDKIKTETETDKADELDSRKGSGFTDEEIASMEKMFGVTDDIDAGGWLLPDGRLLDFNRDYHKEGQENWDEHGDILKTFSAERKKSLGITGEGKRIDGLMKGIKGALQAGGIRYDNGPDGLYMDIGIEPSKEQYDFLEQMAQHDWSKDPFADGDGHVITIGGDKKVLIYPDNETLRKRLVSDIKKFFADDGKGHEDSPDAEAVRMFHGDRFSKQKGGKVEGFAEGEKEELEKTAKDVERYIPGVKVIVSPRPFSPNGDKDVRKRIIGRELARWQNFVNRFTMGGMKITKDKDGNVTHDETFDDHLVLEHTPVVLQRLGVPDRPIGVAGEIIQKILGYIPTKDHKWHRTTEKDFRTLLYELDNPVAVLKHPTEKDKVIVLTRMIDEKSLSIPADGGEATSDQDIVSLVLDKKTKNQPSVHLITTCFGENKKGFQDWIDEGNLIYVNKHLIQAPSLSWLKFPKGELTKPGLLTEADFADEDLGRPKPNPPGDVDPHLRLFLDDDGVVVGTYNRKTNEVTLYPGANADTIAHELCGHATWQYAEQQAAKGNKTLLNKMNEVVDTEIAKPVWEEVAANYDGENHDVQREEVWAHIVGHKGSKAIAKIREDEKGKKWYQKAWGVVKDAWKGLLSKAGLNRIKTDGIEQMQPEEFADYMVEQMTSGKTLGRLGKGEKGQEVPNTNKAATFQSLMAKRYPNLNAAAIIEKLAGLGSRVEMEKELKRLLGDA